MRAQLQQLPLALTVAVVGVPFVLRLWVFNLVLFSFALVLAQTKNVGTLPAANRQRLQRALWACNGLCALLLLALLLVAAFDRAQMSVHCLPP